MKAVDRKRPHFRLRASFKYAFPYINKRRITVFFVVISLINPLTEFSAAKLVREIKVRYVNAYYIAMAEKSKSLSEDGASFQFPIIN